MSRTLLIGTLLALGFMTTSATAAPADSSIARATARSASMDRYCETLGEMMWNAWASWSVANAENQACWAEDIRTAPERCAGEVRTAQITRRILDDLIEQHEQDCAG